MQTNQSTFSSEGFLLAADFLLLLLWPFITLGLKLFGDFSDESSHFTMNRLIVIITVYSNLLRFVSVLLFHFPVSKIPGESHGNSSITQFMQLARNGDSVS